MKKMTVKHIEAQAAVDLKYESPHAFRQHQLNQTGNGRCKNPLYIQWLAQIQANMDAGMSDEQAEELAGVAPRKHVNRIDIPQKYGIASGKSGPAFEQLDYEMTIADFEAGTGRI